MKIAHSENPTIAQNSLRTFVARLVAMLLSVLTGIVVAKFLGPAGKGVYSGTLMAISIVMFAPAGIATAFIYALTRQGRSLDDLLPAAGRLLVWLCAFGVAGTIVWGALRGFSLPVWIFLAAIPPSVVLAWQGSLYIGLGRMRNLNVQSVGIAVATLGAVTVATIVLHLGASGALFGWLGSLYAAAFVVVFHALRLGRPSRRSDVGATVRGLVKFGTPSGINLLLGTLNYRIDSIILIALLGIASFGVYSLAVSFGELLFMLTRPITAAATRDIGVRDLVASGEITAKVIRVCTAIAALASIVAFTLGPWAIHAIYGARFLSGALPLRILLPGIVAFATAGTFAAFFIVQLGKPQVVTVINVAMIGLQALACLVLVPRLGMAGAALASTLTYVAGASMNTIWFCRVTGVSPRDVWVIKPADVRIVWHEARMMLHAPRNVRVANLSSNG